MTSSDFDFLRLAIAHHAIHTGQSLPMPHPSDCPCRAERPDLAACRDWLADNDKENGDD